MATLPVSWRNRYHEPPMNDSAPPTASNESKSWWQRLSAGLRRTSSSIGTAITDLVAKRKLDRALLDEIEELLIRSDLGVDTAARITEAIGQGRYDKEIAPDEVKA